MAAITASLVSEVAGSSFYLKPREIIYKQVLISLCSAGDSVTASVLGLGRILGILGSGIQGGGNFSAPAVFDVQNNILYVGTGVVNNAYYIVVIGTPKTS